MKKQGFTFLEMSIVIIIISLIVGVVFAGQEILKNSKVNSIPQDAEKFRTAIFSFKQKYSYYPGDLPTAETFWGTKSTPSCTAAGVASTTATIATCNGRGNGVIGMLWTDATLFGSTGNIDVEELREKFTIWQHLANAGFIEGMYSGFSSDVSDPNVISVGVNVPKSRYKEKMGFTLEYSSTVYPTQSPTRNFPVAGNIRHLFSWSNPAAGIDTSAMITAIDALQVDTKIDDGLPYTGKIFAFGNNAQATTYGVNNCVVSSLYNSTTTTAPCAQYFREFLESNHTN